MRTPEPELDRALEAFSKVVFDATPRDEDLAALGSRDRARFFLYRDLVRSRFRDLVATALPRTTRTLGRAQMDALVEARLSEAPPTTRFFREVPHGLIAPGEPRLPRDAHPHLDDLLRLELAQWRAAWDDPPVPEVQDFDLGRRPVVSPTLVRLELAWSVHRAEQPPLEGEFHVAVYRRRDGIVETRWMDATMASILDLWILGELTAIEAVRAALAARSREPTPEIVDQMSELLAQLLERGGMLGSR